MKISVKSEKEKKIYLADAIGDDFWDWKGKKIFIAAPTGMGKTTFVVKVLLKHLKRRGKKLLILCNRRLLRMQYWHSVIEDFVSYAEIEECVKIITYQELAEKVKYGGNLKRFFDNFEMIVNDECHFFYCDSDFNGFGTYALLQEIACGGAVKTMIFMSATMEEVKPLIEQTLKNCMCRLSRTGRNDEIRKENEKILSYDYMRYADYSRFHCVYVPDMETLCQTLVKSPKKSLIFINNKEKGALFVEELVKTGEIDRTNIEILNADNIDVERDVVQNLVITNKLRPKILITTAVLDNGVSIHDSDVANIVIETESKTEFLQMLGRIRGEDVSESNLYFVRREKKDFSIRMNRYEKDVKRFGNLNIHEVQKNHDFYIQEIMADGEMADFYKRALVWMKFSSQFYVWPENENLFLNKDQNFYINEFAKRKIGDMYVMENRFYMLAMSNPLKVVYEQMSWIGKGEDELQILESEYRAMREQEFIKKLLSVQKYTHTELKMVKEELVKEYRKDFFADVLAKNGTISNEKLSMVIEKYGLKLVIEENAENRNKVYTIVGADREEE